MIRLSFFVALLLGLIAGVALFGGDRQSFSGAEGALARGGGLVAASDTNASGNWRERYPAIARRAKDNAVAQHGQGGARVGDAGEASESVARPPRVVGILGEAEPPRALLVFEDRLGWHAHGARLPDGSTLRIDGPTRITLLRDQQDDLTLELFAAPREREPTAQRPRSTRRN